MDIKHFQSFNSIPNIGLAYETTLGSASVLFLPTRLKGYESGPCLWDLSAISLDVCLSFISVITPDEVFVAVAVIILLFRSSWATSVEKENAKKDNFILFAFFATF